jgi:hypothetical protein
MVYTLVTDGFQHGRTLLGETVEDLLRWEEWLAAERAYARSMWPASRTAAISP